MEIESCLEGPPLSPLNPDVLPTNPSEMMEESDIIHIQVTDDEQLLSVIQNSDVNDTIIIVDPQVDNVNNDKLVDNQNELGIEINRVEVELDRLSKNSNAVESDNESEQEVNIKESVRGRKRKKNHENWMQTVRKRRRQSGKDYINVKGKKVEGRKIIKSCRGNCRFKCPNHISDSNRKEIFKTFWSLSDAQKNLFYAKTIEKNMKHRTRTTNECSKRKYSFQYSFEVSGNKVRVCKEFYLNKGRLQWFFKKPSMSFDDKRGKHSKRKIDMNEKQKIYDHINSFPKVPSHYCRSQTKREYLDPNLSISKMYELYVEECNQSNTEPQKYYLYRNIFNTEFNLGFHIPKKDLCDLCEEIKASGTDVSGGLETKYQVHIDDKEKTKKERDGDKIQKNLFYVLIYRMLSLVQEQMFLTFTKESSVCTILQPIFH